MSDIATNGDDGALAGIEPIEIQVEMERSFLEYAMSVIVSRALPDVRDGLKPVHRRILYGMVDVGARTDRPHMKSARVTGHVMGQYHPHGNQPIYDALVRMAQDFSLRHPLIDGHGNFGSPDNPPAAERYCVTGDTLVRTVDGTRRIADLAEVEPDGEVDLDVKVLDKDAGPVLATKLFHSGDHPTLRLRTTEGFAITGTANHPLLCLEPVAGVPMLQWRLLEEIRAGMRVVVNRTPADDAVVEASVEERQLAEGLASEARSVGGVPSVAWEGSPGLKRSFLHVLLGCEEATQPVPATEMRQIGALPSQERVLAEDVQRLLLEFGVVARLLTGPGTDEVALAVGGSVDHIPYVAEYERSEAGRGTDADDEVRSVIRPLVEPGYHYAEVESVTPAGVQPVYSVRVDSDDHSFLANGFVNHNTECRLAPLANVLLDGIDENTVDLVDNYSGEFKLPGVLPARFPNLLVNGSQGIAVGMATNIPPHNLGEVIDATTHLLDHPEATVEDLMRFVLGPDFPTGAFILGRSGIGDAYRTGRGSIKLRARAEIEERKDASFIVVSELPYQASPAAILGRIGELVEARELEGIADVNDESAGDTTRMVVKLKRDANANVVLNNLYRLTPLQTSFGVNMVALVDGVPRTLGLKPMLEAYIEHQIEVITRRTQFRLDKATKRAHILEGLIRALDLIDQIIALIRGAEDVAAARLGLQAEPFSFSEVQAEFILDLQLRRLTRLARVELDQELAERRAEIAELESILADDGRKRTVIKDELAQVRSTFATPRRAEIALDPGDLATLDFIDDEELVVTLSAKHYVKTVAADAFRSQVRGGRGVAGTKLRDDDYVTHIVSTTAHAYLLFFSNRGRVYRLRAHEIPMKERTARGTAIVNLLPLGPDERIQAVIDTRDYETSRYLFFATREGQVKKTRFNEYDSSLRAGLIAISLKEGDELVRVIPTNGESDIFMVSAAGMTIRFSETEVRSMGRSAAGVRGMRLRTDDVVVSCDVARDEVDILMVTDAGYGKRTKLERFNAQARGGQGVRGIRLTARRGAVVAAFMAGLEDEILVITSGGQVIRMPVRGISSQGRDATGVRLMSLADGQSVAAVAPVLSVEDVVPD